MTDVFSVGTVSVQPGELATGWIESAFLRDGSRVRIPLIVVHGVEPGPVLWVGSTMHGDEIPGCEVIRRLTRERLNPRTVRGTVIAAPVQNPVAFLTGTRLSEHDGVNINRVFPGNPKGSLTERIAYDLFHQGAGKAGVVLDIHSNSLGAVCFSIVRTGGRGRAWDEQWEIADAFGISVAVGPIGQLSFDGTPTAGGLHDVSLAAGKPALTVELSGGFMWEESSVRAGVSGVLNVMKHLGMVDGPREPQTEVLVLPGRLTERRYLTCNRGGFVRPLKQIGSTVQAGDAIAALYDVFGEEVEVVRSPIDGWVITYDPITGNKTVVSGDSIAFVFGIETASR